MTEEQFLRGKEYLLAMPDNWNPELAEQFLEAMQSDDELPKQINRLAWNYLESTTRDQMIIDDVLSYLCGYTLRSLIAAVGANK